jgi:hypothetical protein
MLTGDIRSQIDGIWNAFWSGGISNPIEVIEQITYLLFLRRLDDLHTLEENKATPLKVPIERRIFPEGKDGLGRDGGREYADLRWSHFKHFPPADMYAVVSEHVFPFLRTLGGDGSTYAHHMKDARFTIPTPAPGQSGGPAGQGAHGRPRQQEPLYARTLLAMPSIREVVAKQSRQAAQETSAAPAYGGCRCLFLPGTCRLSLRAVLRQ